MYFSYNLWWTETPTTVRLSVNKFLVISVFSVLMVLSKSWLVWILKTSFFLYKKIVLSVFRLFSLWTEKTPTTIRLSVKKSCKHPKGVFTQQKILNFCVNRGDKLLCFIQMWLSKISGFLLFYELFRLRESGLVCVFFLLKSFLVKGIWFELY